MTNEAPSRLTTAEAAQSLRQTGGTILALVDGMPEEMARWRPAEGKWAVHEIVCHLADEEAEDFRVRLDYTLHRPGEKWPAIDPEGWVTARDYAARDRTGELARFLEERARSVAWLESLDDPDLELFYEHPYGQIRGGDLLVSWMDHDLLHIRQILKLRHEYVAVHAEPYDAGYAGGAW